MRVDIDVDAMASLLAKVETAAANVEVDNWTAFQHDGDTFVFVQNGNMSLESGDGLIQLVGYTGELNDSNMILPAARSEERRVGKECVSTCRSRWSPVN